VDERASREETDFQYRRQPSDEQKAKIGSAELDASTPATTGPTDDCLVLPSQTVDPVHFSVTSPKMVLPNSSFVLDVWAHLKQQREEVIQRARESLGGEEIRIASKGPVSVAQGTVLTVKLSIPGLLVEEGEDTVTWDHDIGHADFCVMVPNDAADGPRSGKASICVNGMQIVRIYFTVLVGRNDPDVAALPIREERNAKAFVSYASEDRNDVMGRVQGILKAVPQMEVFLDVVSLRSGDDWERELFQVIPASDVFYLFWSENALNSAWVEKEWRCALSSRGVEFIDPVPLQPPELAPPPPELASKHFNDWVLAYMREQKRAFADASEARGTRDGRERATRAPPPIDES
jgi:hypothetical protein